MALAYCITLKCCILSLIVVSVGAHFVDEVSRWKTWNAPPLLWWSNRVVVKTRNKTNTAHKTLLTTCRCSAIDTILFTVLLAVQHGSSWKRGGWLNWWNDTEVFKFAASKSTGSSTSSSDDGIFLQSDASGRRPAHIGQKFKKTTTTVR